MFALFSFLAGACGSGEGGRASAPSAPSSAVSGEPTTVAAPTTTVKAATPTTAMARTTVTTRPAPTPAQDRATAQRILFAAADVPGMAPASPNNFAARYAQCGKNPLLPGGDDPRQAVPVAFLKDETAELRRLQTTALGAYAALTPTEAGARAVVATLRSPEFRACLERELTAAANGQISGGTPVVLGAATADLPTPALGDEVVAFRVTLTERNSRHDFELSTVRKGRAIASVFTSRLGNVAFPDDERVRLVRLLVSRMP
jgi:hypothetical protein